MLCRPAAFWALALAAAAWTAAAVSIDHADERHAIIPPVVRPLHRQPGHMYSQGDEAGTPPQGPGAPPPLEDCEDGEWSSGSFVGGLAGGVVATLLGTLLPAAYVHRTSPEEAKDQVLGAAPEDAKDTKAQLEGKKEASSESEASTPGRERASRPKVSAQHGCTEEVESLHLFWPRAGFLVVMLLLQSISSLILAGFEGLIENQTALIYFLTMIVGLGGNAGGQSLILAVRGLATGKQVNVAEHLMTGFRLSVVLSPVAFARVFLSHSASFGVCITVALASSLVLVASTAAGASIPVLFLALGVDPAHGATMIQVLMDISGIAILCVVAAVVLGA